MRHYEIVILVRPDQSQQVEQMLERYKTLIEKNGGKIHRLENWGRRQLAYPIKKLAKAHYLLLNIEVDIETKREIETNFRYNDSILRHLIIKRPHAIKDRSSIMNKTLELQEKERVYEEKIKRETKIKNAAIKKAADERRSEEKSTHLTQTNTDTVENNDAVENDAVENDAVEKSITKEED